MGRDGLLVFPNGICQYVASLTEGLLAEYLGPRYVTKESEECDVRVAMHELTRVALLPINPHASGMTGVAIGGPVVVHARENQPLGRKYSSPAYAAQVLANCSDHRSVRRLENLVRTSLSNTMFEGVRGDRWLLLGRNVVAVISGTLRGSQEKEHDVWLIGPDQPEPFTVRVVEYTLLEAMEYMIEVDGLVAEGSPPDEFLAAVSRLGLRS